MNILYGVNATGNGHISRSRITISELKKRGHKVTVLFSGRDVKDFFDLEEFRPYIIKQGFTFDFKKGKLNVFKTLLNIDLIQFVRDVFKIKKEYDVVVTDFEPISAYAARKLGIHCIGIGHQYSFLKKIPKSFKMKLASLFFLRFYTPINSTISSHFYHFNQSILPPFIEKGLKNQNAVPLMKNTFLVYLAWEERDQMISILNTIKDNEFIYYSSVDKEIQIGNVTLKPFSNKNFKKDLIACNGLITNAGFQLPAEAIYLGKKILCKPLSGQPEQEHNAKTLKRMEHATVCLEFTKDKIEYWIRNGKQKIELYNDSIDLMIEMIENPKKDFANRISELWI
tara:strand:+ start:8156 stop:9175 length:1020 start_codon:yes stop_codon:yes gene_type:complete